MGSAILVDPAVENAKTAAIGSRRPAAAGIKTGEVQQIAENEPADQHPLVPVFLIGGMALIASLAFVGSILIWLSLQYSGVLAQ